MKLLFVHDHPFYKEGSDIYSGGGLPNTIWNNYQIFFSELIVFGRRSQNLKDKKVLSSSSSDSCKFYLTEKYSSISSLLKNYSSISNELSQQIKHADVVLVRLPSVLGFIAANVAKKLNKKIIVEQVGNAKEALSTHGSLLGKIAAPVFEMINKRTVAYADYVIYVTQHKLQLDYPAKTIKTASLSDVVIPDIVQQNQILDSRFSENTFTIGLIGGFDARYKGQDVLLKAVSILPSDIRDNIQLYFVGKGDYNWLLKIAETYKLKDNIKYIGGKESGIEVFDFLDSLSLYIQPSLTEGMPRALLEAMSRGCAVLGSNVGGIPDVVNDRFIHTIGNYKKIASDIELLYNNRDLLRSESSRSIEEIQPYLKSKLDKRRKYFFNQIINDLNNA